MFFKGGPADGLFLGGGPLFPCLDEIPFWV
jgi:hypothetical protein